jgi:hypothetical protein
VLDDGRRQREERIGGREDALQLPTVSDDRRADLARGHLLRDDVDGLVRLDDVGILGHRLVDGDALGIDVLQGLDQVDVVAAEDADDLALLHDGQVSDVVLAHQPRGLGDGLGGLNQNEHGGHVLVDRQSDGRHGATSSSLVIARPRGRAPFGEVRRGAPTPAQAVALPLWRSSSPNRVQRTKK